MKTDPASVIRDAYRSLRDNISLLTLLNESEDSCSLSCVNGLNNLNCQMLFQSGETVVAFIAFVIDKAGVPVFYGAVSRLSVDSTFLRECNLIAEDFVKEVKDIYGYEV